MSDPPELIELPNEIQPSGDSSSAHVEAGSAPAGGEDFFSQERTQAAGGSSWQPYDFPVSDFEVVPETLTEFGDLLMTDADEFKTGLDHALGQAMSALPNFGMSTGGVLADGDQLTTAYYAAFQSLSTLMGEVAAGLANLGGVGLALGTGYEFGDGNSEDMLEAMRHYFGETTLWGNDPNSPFDMEQLQRQAEDNFEQIREDAGDTDVDVTSVEVNDEGQLEAATEDVPMSGSEASENASDRTMDEIYDDVDQQLENNERFPAGEAYYPGSDLDPEPLIPDYPAEGHPAETIEELT